MTDPATPSERPADGSELAPDECQWRQKGAGHYLDGRVCREPWVFVCSKKPREKYVCARHAGAHKRERPNARACADADHSLLVRSDD